MQIFDPKSEKCDFIKFFYLEKILKMCWKKNLDAFYMFEDKNIAFSYLKNNLKN